MGKRWSRRDVLKGALTLGGGLVLSTGMSSMSERTQLALASGATITDRYFIFCYFSGGWDLLISLDPRNPSEFREDLKKVTRIQPGYHLLPSGRQNLVTTTVPGMTFGPFIGNLTRHASKIALVRGMSMDTLTHEVGRRRFLTGRQPAGLQARGSSLDTVMAAQLGSQELIPNLSVGVEAYNEGQPDFASAIRVTSVNDLVRALRPGAASLDAIERQAVNELLEELRSCPVDQVSAFRSRGYTANIAAQELVGRNLSGLFDFAANTPQMIALRARYGINPLDLTSGQAQAAMAVTALEAGISRCVSITAAADLDAHGPAWASGHGPKLEDGFNVIAAMIDDLAARQYKSTGDSWLDHTTVVVFSEFGRTALVNSSGGRDHALTNGCMLIGAGIRGGRVIGRSSDLGMTPVSTNLETGAPDPEGGIIVKPEHVHRALLRTVGITEDILDLRAEPLRAILR